MERAGGIRELPASTSIQKMRRYSASQWWEDRNKQRQEAEIRELEAQRAAATLAMQQQIEGSRNPTSVSDTLPVCWPQQLQGQYQGWGRHRRDDVSELEAPWSPPPEYQQQAPPTPPASDGEAPDVGDYEQITQLQKEVTYKESVIERLECELGAERNKKRRLQAERHEAVDAQRRAENDVYKLKRQVANLDELLAGSIKREKELESELDAARQEITKLKRQLYEEQCSYENETRAREMHERRIVQQVEDTRWALKGEQQCKKSPESKVAD